MKKHTNFVKWACGITASALVLGAVGMAGFQTEHTPDIVRAEKLTEESATTAEESDARTLEETVTAVAGSSDDSVSKEETVYVFADETGKVQSVLWNIPRREVPA